LNALKHLALAVFLSVGFASLVIAGERTVIDLHDFTLTEMKCGGFRLLHKSDIHLLALGAGGERRFGFSEGDLYACAWIINADTREEIWRMTRGNTSKQGHERKFDGELTLPSGSYELYFSAFAISGGSAFANFDVNVDPRTHNVPEEKRKHNGFFDWFGNMFGENVEKEWQRRAKDWGIELLTSEDVGEIQTFAPPKEMPNVLFKATRLGENEHVRQQFVLSRPASLRIYAIGESVNSREFADYGWIVDARSHRRIWEMKKGNVRPAGGASKNYMFDGTVTFPAGEYSLYFITDDSHSFVDWNAAPPSDPFSYGITLMAVNEGDRSSFKLTSNSNEEANVVVQLVRIGNDETRSAAFSLKERTQLRVYAIGEGEISSRKMADRGWIIDARTREKVWEMDIDHTEHAGGAEKNRMADEIIELPKGDYEVMYQSDGSHAYNDWNSSPPYDPEHYGITVYGEGEHFDIKNVDLSPSAHNNSILAQIVRVGDNEDRSKPFHLSEAKRVRIYAIGEGQNREMFDYGWIVNAATGRTVWEMTYGMTFHAGGGRKNRSVKTTMTLEKGDYVLHYKSDDSHSYNDWNTDPPDDPTMWGITVYAEPESSH
jgi:hypothetical protein